MGRLVLLGLVLFAVSLVSTVAQWSAHAEVVLGYTGAQKATLVLEGSFLTADVWRVEFSNGNMTLVECDERDGVYVCGE